MPIRATFGVDKNVDKREGSLAVKVRRKIHSSGKLLWEVDFGLMRQPDGTKKRVQRYYPTKDAAVGALAEAKAKREFHGDASFALSEQDRARFMTARDQLAKVGATIEEAVVHFLRTKPAACEHVPLETLLNRCIDEKQRLGKSLRYLQQFRCSCLSFIRGRELELAHEITREQVDSWVHGNGWGPKTQRVYLGDLRTLFAFALEKGYAANNPCSAEGAKRIRLAEMVASPIATLTASQAKVILSRAARVPGAPEEEDFRPLLTYVALGLFCGIRPAELERLDRAAVSVSERHVVIEASQSKTRRRRVVDISENCVHWLALDPTSDGPVAPTNFRRRWARLRAAAGWRPELQALSKSDPRPAPSLPEWPHDVMRHTFASMHYAAHQNESLLKAQMGHSAAEDVLFRHYRALKTRAEAAAFWALVPMQENA